jgi:hypothetical protein
VGRYLEWWDRIGIGLEDCQLPVENYKEKMKAHSKKRHVNHRAGALTASLHSNLGMASKDMAHMRVGPLNGM